MKKFKYRKELLPYIIKVLAKKRIRFILQDNELSCACSGRKFHRVIEEAMCLKQQGNSNIPVIPYRIAVSEERKKYGTVFRILKRDLHRFENAF